MSRYRNAIIAVLVAVCLLAGFGSAGAEDVVISEAAKVIRLVSGKSVILKTDSHVSRVSIADPEAAGLMLLSPRQVYLTGKTFGTTNLTLWKGGRAMQVYDVQVVPDVSGLKRMLHELLPNEKGIKVMANSENITLAGSVTNAASLTAALNLAETVAPEKVVNLLRLDGVQQVMLEVRVAEMSRSVLNRMGVNFNTLIGQFTFYSFLNNLTSLNAEGTLTTMTDRINSVLSYSGKTMNFQGFIDALKSHGLARTLAEPNLICVSGESAHFLAGGEIPIPMPGALGTVGIEFKPFGVGLEFTPTVMSSDLINLKVAPEVSELDYSRSLELDGYEIPAITTRRASTVIELADGQSFAIAGLVSESLKENNYRFPVLGDIPVLGTLFRSVDFQKGKTELVIIVTAHLVKPLDRDKQTLPTDGFREPDDYEFFLLGLLEGQGNKSASAGSRGMNGAQPAGQPVPHPESGFDGDLGHAWPQ
ncbi:type II and III secretion system protein family protein [Salidesulfovibrio onnuriiensis]|uniref:type II and III secretion system protein family protein n=1 Tax=Salidesulfovibrio onnuriiensis TaxID=2583823 RepID=UPI0011C7B697|nr:type II and III secretion system protein family protein [Salidesulfovibrio onnuriiensis]